MWNSVLLSLARRALPVTALALLLTLGACDDAGKEETPGAVTVAEQAESPAVADASAEAPAAGNKEPDSSFTPESVRAPSPEGQGAGDAPLTEADPAAGDKVLEGAVSAPGPEPAPAPEILAVYRLAEPGRPASPAERDTALAIVEYTNRVYEVLRDSECGRRPLRILAAVDTYRELFVAERVPGTPPAESCARELAKGTRLFGVNGDELEGLLRTMDEQRVAMQQDYTSLRRYMADESIMDDGELGERLCRSMEESYAVFEDARSLFLESVDARGEEAQLVLLRDHPLREQVRLALHLFSDMSRASDRIAPGEPDPKALSSFIEAIDADATTAERLPFPIPGEVEMNYRHFLKEVRVLQGILARGCIESFHAGVRADLSSSFRECHRRYNLFLDAMEALRLRGPR